MSDDRKDLPPVNAPNFSEKLRETVSTYLGNRGHKLDRGVTLRDLTEAGIITLRAGYLSGAGGAGSPVEGLVPAVDGAYEKDLTPPPTPTGFSVSAGISTLFFSHDAPIYPQGHGHAKTIVYGVTRTTGALPVFSNAVRITEFSGAVFAYPTNPATTWHLWITWMSMDGVESTAPAGGTNGLAVTTGQDVSLLLEALAGEITESQLYADLGSRIDLIDGPATLPNSLAQNAAFLRSYSDLGSKTFRYTNPPVRRGWDPQTGLDVPLGIGDLWIDTNDGNKQYQWTGSEWVYSPDGAIAAVDARVTNVETTKIGYCTIGGTPSDHTTGPTCTAAGGVWHIGLPLATAVKQVSVTSGGQTASLEQKFIAQATANDGLLAQYTVKIDAAGLISGYGLASTVGTAGPKSAFGVRANQFYIAPPAVAQNTAPTANLYDGYVWLDTSVTPNVTRYRSGTGWTLTSPVLPFVVQATPTTINGVLVPAGVYMPTTFIKNATITQAQIGSVKADSITAGVLQAVVSQTGAMFNGVNAYTMTTHPNTGVVTASYTGQAPGTADFGTGYYIGTLSGAPQLFVGSPTAHLLWNGSSLTVRGTVYATAGQIGGNTIDSTGMQSPGYVAGSSGWRLNSDGSFYANTGTYRGAIHGSQFTTGAFTGFAWPAAGNYGSYLGPSGLLLGNSNNGQFVQIDANGRFRAPGIDINNGVMTINQVDVIDTLNIAGEAVLVPRVDARTDTITGSGANVVVAEVDVTMSQAGWLYANFTANQYYGSGLRTSVATLTVAGVSTSVGGAAVTTNIAVTQARYLSAGTHHVEVAWNGQDAGVQIGNRTLYAQGAMR